MYQNGQREDTSGVSHLCDDLSRHELKEKSQRWLEEWITTCGNLAAIVCATQRAKGEKKKEKKIVLRACPLCFVDSLPHGDLT